MSTRRALTLWCTLTLTLGALQACAPTLLRPSARSEVARSFVRRAEALIERGDLEGAPINSVELALALYKGHPSLEGRVPRSLTTKGVWSLGVRRAGPPEVGDMLLFKPLKGALEVAFVLEVVEAQALRAVAITRGAPRVIYAHLKLPHTRRLDGELINSYVRRPSPSRSQGNELENSGYLAGELLDEVRALF